MFEFIDSFSNTLSFAGYRYRLFTQYNTEWVVVKDTSTYMYIKNNMTFEEKKHQILITDPTFLFHAVLCIFADVTHTTEVHNNYQ